MVTRESETSGPADRVVQDLHESAAISVRSPAWLGELVAVLYAKVNSQTALIR